MFTLSFYKKSYDNPDNNTKDFNRQSQKKERKKILKNVNYLAVKSWLSLQIDDDEDRRNR